MADRHDAKVSQETKFNPFDSDAFDAGITDLFQFMIGNTDWSSIFLHNVVVVRTRSGIPIAVPFDLDFAGLVNASYAGPPPNLQIRSVKNRIFRGICRPDIEWSRLFEHFAHKRAAIMALVDHVPDLSRKHRNRVADYLTGFFELLDNSKQRKKKISNACRPIAPETIIAHIG